MRYPWARLGWVLRRPSGLRPWWVAEERLYLLTEVSRGGWVVRQRRRFWRRVDAEAFLARAVRELPPFPPSPL